MPRGRKLGLQAPVNSFARVAHTHHQPGEHDWGPDGIIRAVPNAIADDGVYPNRPGFRGIDRDVPKFVPTPHTEALLTVARMPGSR
jgi:hypothetical protein